MYSVFTLPHDFLNREYTEEEKNSFDDAIHNAITGQLDEELTDAQKKKVSNWSPDRDVREAHDEVFGKDNDRIILPYDSSSDKKVSTTNQFPSGSGLYIGKHRHHTHVLSTLQKHNYFVDDYSSGLTYHLDSPERKEKIGKVLTKLGVDTEETNIRNKDGKIMNLGEVYAADPARSATKGEKQIVITRNKYDVAGMSTGRGWTSCMHMVDGCNRRYLPKDIDRGTLTAYLTKVGDDGIKNPIGRINLKNFTTGSHNIFRPEGSSYGSIPQKFKEVVSNWSEEKYPSKPGIYMKHSALYNDDGESMKFEKLHEMKGDGDFDIRHHVADLVTSMRSHVYDNPKAGYEEYDDAKNNLVDAAHSLVGHYYKNISPEHFAKKMTDHIVEHFDDNRGSNTEMGDIDFDDLDRYNLTHDVAKTHLENKTHIDRIKDGLSAMSDDDLTHHLGKIHSTIEKTENDDHEPIAQLHSYYLNEVFNRPHLHELHDKIISDVLKSDSDITHEHYNKMIAYALPYDKKHPVELTKNPRLMQKIVERGNESNYNNTNFNDIHLTKSHFKHIGIHADAKLADYIYSVDNNHNHYTDEFTQGLNENPDGEHIQHKIIEPMLLVGGKRDRLTHDSTTGTYVPFKTSLKYDHQFRNWYRNDEDRKAAGEKIASKELVIDDEENSIEPYRAIASHTKFKSVHDRLISRMHSDLYHPEIHKALKSNDDFGHILHEERRNFKDLQKMIGLRK